MRRGLLIAAFLAAIAFIMAHIINLMVAHALTRHVTIRQTPAGTETRLIPAINRVRLTEAILSSGVFGGPDTTVETASLRTKSNDASNVPDPLASMTPPIDAAKKVKLVGTVVGEGEVSMAVVEEISTKRQTLYRLHDVIPNVGRIAQIRKDGILIRQGAQHETLSQDYAVSAVSTNASIIATPAPADIATP